MTIWTQHRASLRKHLEIDSLDNFLQWSTIQATMFVGDVDFVRQEYIEIMLGRCFKASTIAETKIGSPPLMWGWTSGNLIHQYYHLKQWLDLTKQDITQMRSIVEVGAGYGAMALICYRLGFMGRYYIVDLPELEYIQAHYLNRTMPERRSMIYWIESPKSCDLFIASHSLGEMPTGTRERLLSQALRVPEGGQVTAKEYLFASSYEFEGIDNQRWFHQLAGSTQGVDWKFYPHRWQENAFYMVGTEL